MPKRALTIEAPPLALDHTSAVPLYRQLYERLRAAILSGRLEAGARLPSTRSLASELGVSRTTTALVYQQLLLEGYLESRVGAGSSVSMRLPRPPAATPRAPVDERPTSAQHATLPDLSQRGRLFLHPRYQGGLGEVMRRDNADIFRAGHPDLAAFPYDLWARLLAKRARHSLPTAAQYQDAQGYAPLREAIAAHIGITRGVRCTPAQVIVTAGSQGALDLAARALLDPGDVAWIEDPGYIGARGALLAAGAQVFPAPIDEEGLDIAAAQALNPPARLVSVTPSHQFPTGVTMSLNRRVALLDWAQAARAWILEDDYDSEYRFSGRPLEALQGLDNGQRVIYIGTFSKVLFPALRVGYLVVPPDLAAGFVALRGYLDVHPPILEQMTLYDFMQQGHYARHLRQMRARYLERRNALIDALHRELHGAVEIQVPEAGMHLVAWLAPGVDDQVLAQRAQEQGLSITPLSTFCTTPPKRGGLILGYASASSEELRAGVRRLARALHPRE